MFQIMCLKFVKYHSEIFFYIISPLYINAYFLPLSITWFKPNRGKAINITGQIFEVPTVCVANTNTCMWLKKQNIKGTFCNSQINIMCL